MMSLSDLRKNLFQTFTLMRDANATIEVYHRRKVYRIHVEETGLKVQTPYRNKRRSYSVPTAFIKSAPCELCDSLLVNGICMNSKCAASKVPA